MFHGLRLGRRCHGGGLGFVVHHGDGGRGDVHQFEIMRERLDHGAHVVEPARDQPFLQRGARDVEASRAKRGRRRQRRDLDRLLGQALDRPQHAPLTRIDQRDGHALTADAAGAADAVDVHLGEVGMS